VGPTYHPHSCSSRQSSRDRSRGATPFPGSAVGRPAALGFVVERLGVSASGSAVKEGGPHGVEIAGLRVAWELRPPLRKKGRAPPRSSPSSRKQGRHYLGSPRTEGTAAYVGELRPQGAGPPMPASRQGALACLELRAPGTRSRRRRRGKVAHGHTAEERKLPNKLLSSVFWPNRSR
jgi:hypothetical protein